MHNMDTKGINSRYLDRDIATSIGKFFFDKSVNEKLKKEDFTLDTLKERCDLTTMTIDSLKIVNIHFDDKDICITTSRPGLLIGRKGIQIGELKDYLKKEYTFDNLRII